MLKISRNIENEIVNKQIVRVLFARIISAVTSVPNLNILSISSKGIPRKKRSSLIIIFSIFPTNIWLKY